MKNKKLTSKQESVYKFIKNRFIANHRMPTMKDIADHFGFKSPNSAQCFVDYICDKGFLVKVPVGNNKHSIKFANHKVVLQEL